MKQKLLSILALLLMTATGAWAQVDTPLTLEAKDFGQIVVENPPAGMQYKKNDEEKKTIPEGGDYDEGSKMFRLNVLEGDKVQFFGNGTSIKSYYDTRIGHGGVDCYIYGNIMSLVDETEFATATELTADRAFESLFNGCTNLYSHSTNKLVLPATTLTESCYCFMFFMCENLTVAPELPATTLAADCYANMFDDCEGLTVAPALPATTLATYCYYSMFSGCTSLTTAPALPATTLANGCYANMFDGCTSLTTAPALPATTLANICYSNMFRGCTKLNSVTCLATNISASNATNNWLSGVAATGTFTKAPDMEGWTTGASGIPSGWTVVDNVVDMLETPLTLEALTDGTIMVTCSSTLPNEMKYSVNGGAKTAFTTTTTIEGLKAGDKVQFYGNNGNGQGRAQIKGGTAQVKAYGNVMSVLSETGFENATTISEDYALYGLFWENNMLTDAGDLLLPATTLSSSCYSFMFYGCTALTAAPELPAMTLAYGCYASIFSGCTSLNSVTCLATDISAGYATNNWLYNVAATGTLIKAVGMTSWPSGKDGIPDGWTVQDYGTVTLTDGGGLSALSAYAGKSCTVTYTRSFTANKPSTVCLPFAYAPKTGETFYTFTGITKEGGNYVATMTEHTGATLAANTPYLYKSATTGDTDFSGTYTIPATIAAGTTTSGDWTFVGTYETQEWTTAPTGIYGFSAQNTVGGISQGEFVKVGAYVRIKPMRAYLKYKDGGEDYAGAPMMAPRRADEVLPERISVRLIDGDGQVTAIGTLETRTGEVTLDGWYTLDGTRLSGQPTQKGIYVNNGKKVIIK